MLKKIDLNLKMDKKLYKEEKKQLEERLESLQQKIIELNIPIILAFEGFGASGKGTIIGKILRSLDPRNFKVYTMDKASEDVVMRPFLWSYWTKIPSKGLITIFDKSWCRLILPENIERWKLSEFARENFYYDVNAFEKQITDDGTLVLKFFLHISQEEQKKRFHELEKNPDTKWRVDRGDWAQNHNYEAYLNIFEQIIKKTNNSDSPWSIIEANDHRFATAKVLRLIVQKIEEAIEKRSSHAHKASSYCSVSSENASLLEAVKVNREIDPKEYGEMLAVYQSKISDLGFKLYAERKSVVIVYEGWDAAGKGGNIKRLTEELDPRGYEVIPISSPSREELAHHYLWRFWNKMPKDGHIAIFDRSWYGRVMVERIEGYCTEDEWQRAYKEMNDMERHLIHHGVIIFKFWLHIDSDEQLRRFESRQNNPAKQHKITEEDWRNREKWGDYEKCANEMLLRTSTEYAPWIIVESNNKKYARIKTLKLVVEELEKRLK